VERLVYTSSIAALDVHEDRTPATEDTLGTLADRIGARQRSKSMAEDLAREYAGRGLPVVIVNLSTAVGVGDHKPTPSGQTIVDFLAGRMFGYVDMGLNIVDVEDVWASGTSSGGYLTLKRVLDLLAGITERPRVVFPSLVCACPGRQSRPGRHQCGLSPECPVRPSPLNLQRRRVTSTIS